MLKYNKNIKTYSYSSNIIVVQYFYTAINNNICSHDLRSIYVNLRHYLL